MLNAPPQLTVAGACASITLCRAAMRNRMDDHDIGVFSELLARVDQMDDVRALVLRADSGTFCSGYDLNSLASAERTNSPGFDHMVDELERLRIPTIAAVTGGIFGGGTDLALACDFRLGMHGVSMRMPAARIGVHYYYGGMRRYVARLGLGAAKRLFLTGEEIDAMEMLRIGYLDVLVAPDALDEHVNALVAMLAENSPLAVQGMKRALNEIADGVANAAHVDDAWHRSLASNDLSEGLAALAEKRTPVFATPAADGKMC